MYNNREYQYINIAGSATVVPFTGKGILGNVVINSVGTGGTITITDQGSPVVNVALITLGTCPYVTPATLIYNVVISSSLKIVTTASPNITVTYTTG